ncbi:MAG: hypothetical protein HPY69_19580 [Armatimonadetes bacterium]|nr:hypothetical protein [Armatimonadota bacterium]
MVRPRPSPQEAVCPAEGWAGRQVAAWVGHPAEAWEAGWAVVLWVDLLAVAWEVGCPVEVWGVGCLAGAWVGV